MKSYRIVDTMAKDQAKQKPCVVCKSHESDPHHLISRGAGGDDVDWNLMPLCRKCHTEVHKLGLTTFSSKHIGAREWLAKHGWEFNEFLNKWKH